MLCDYLAGRSEPCPLCRYDLRGLTSDRCPECGHALTLELVEAEANWPAYITGLVLLAMPLGFYGMITLVGLLTILFFNTSSDYPFFLLCVVNATASAGVLAAWIKSSRWIRSRTFRTRWLLVLACLAWCVCEWLTMLPFIKHG